MIRPFITDSHFRILFFFLFPPTLSLFSSVFVCLCQSGLSLSLSHSVVSGRIVCSIFSRIFLEVIHFSVSFFLFLLARWTVLQKSTECVSAVRMSRKLNQFLSVRRPWDLSYDLDNDDDGDDDGDDDDDI